MKTTGRDRNLQKLIGLKVERQKYIFMMMSQKVRTVRADIT